jgi:DNA helicase-2/ATP-dependent DNA helicase PcrA
MKVNFEHNLKVYSLNVTPYHTYFCNDILSSNCIYEWRNADPGNISKFIKDYNCKQFNLGTNFRSNATIVKASVNLINNNKKRIDKQLRSYTAKEGLVKEYQCQNQFDEIDYVVIKCLQYPASKIAILYRNRTFKYHLEYKLRKANIKYKVNDFLDITDRSAVRTMIACLKLAANKYDYYDLEQAYKALKGIGKKTIDKLKIDTQKAVQELLDAGKLKSIKNLQKSFQLCLNKPLSDLVQLVENEFVTSFDYQRQMKDLLLDISHSYTTTSTDINELADELGLNTKEEVNDETALIELSTIHGFKGIQCNIVIIPWCQMFLDQVPGKPIDIESERRLFYVAITRAESKIYMTYSGPTPQFIKEMKI